MTPPLERRLQQFDELLVAEGVPDDRRVWVLSLVAHALDGTSIEGFGLADVHPSVVYMLGGFTLERIKAAEARGYARGAKEVREAVAALRHGDAAPDEGEDQPRCYLLWDNERGMWWRANGQGYTYSASQAGLYTRDEAVKWALQGAAGGLNKATVIVLDGAV